MEACTYPIFPFPYAMLVCKLLYRVMSDCGLEDVDLIDWSTCFDTIGRSGITSMYGLVL